jgi:uncharacterized integral membrane protein
LCYLFPNTGILDKNMSKDAIIIAIELFLIVCVYLFISHTTINKTFPYIHVQYPLRGLIIFIGCTIVGILAMHIKH